MTTSIGPHGLNRRRLLAWGAGAAGGWITRAAAAQSSANRMANPDPRMPPAGLARVESILDAQGKMTHGLLSIEIDRRDITNVTLHGVPIKPDFQINGDIFFQPLGNGRVVMNADLPFKADELDPFIDQILAHDIVFQAEHQHLYDFSPMVWFIHFRAAGDAEQIARGIKAGLNVTSTPFPQKLPVNPTTPLPAKEIGRILGASPDLGNDGVVNFNVPRKETITLGGIPVSPYLNVAAPIAFQPHGGGENAAAVVDFAMLASEVMPVTKAMRARRWDIGCLYNQETDEHPQLYFSHQFKTGDARQLAQEIRAGLNLTNSKFM
jgi:hypothetical protein